MTWIAETLYRGWAQSFDVLRMLASEKSDYQQIDIFESASHGRVMMLDGAVQITEADEFVYQEMITHVPLIQHGARNGCSSSVRAMAGCCAGCCSIPACARP